MEKFQFLGKTKLYWMLLMLLFFAGCSSATNTPPPTPTPTKIAFSPFDLGIPTAALNSPVVGTLNSSTQMKVNVFFKLNQSQQNQLQKIGTNGQNLENQANKIGITDAQYQQVKSYLGIQNITLHLSTLHTSVEVDGTVQTMSRLFQTTLVNHKYQNRVFYAPKTAPLLPTKILPLIVAITGLDSYSPPLHTGLATQAWHPSTKSSTQADCQVPAGEVLPQDVAHAYGYDQFASKGYTGKGMTINLIEIDGFSQADVANYGACVGYKGRITIKTIGSAPTKPGEETALDFEMIEGLAPNINIVDYQTNDGGVGVVEELKQLIADNTKNTGSGSVVSISLGSAENMDTLNDLNALDQELSVLKNTEHMTVFAASGDCAAFTDGVFKSFSVSFPASDLNVVGVGGTSLSTDANGNRSDEAVWSNQNPDTTQCSNSWGSGGGNSVHFQRPSWQAGKGVVNDASLGFRQVPDVSAVATNLPLYFDGQWQTFDDGTGTGNTVGAGGGTSAATPIWATGMALVNQATIHNYRLFYAGPSVFYGIANNRGKFSPYFDVTEGNNLGFNATPGWDFATGLGTPNLVDFYQILAATSSKK
jgi:kumamolisin